MGDLIGYARVSTTEQNAELQIDALTHAGCKKIYQEKVSGTADERPELDKALGYVREGDTLVVWRLDRLGRSLHHLIETVKSLEERGVGFMSLQEHINTTTPSGKLIFHIFASLAEFERGIIRERTIAGLNAARKRGRHGGRIPVVTEEKALEIKEMYDSGEFTLRQISEKVEVSRTSVYRSLAKTGKKRRTK